MLNAYPVPWCHFSLPFTHLYTCTYLDKFFLTLSHSFPFFCVIFFKAHPSGTSFVLLEAILAVSEGAQCKYDDSQDMLVLVKVK